MTVLKRRQSLGWPDRRCRVGLDNIRNFRPHNASHGSRSTLQQQAVNIAAAQASTTREMATELGGTIKYSVTEGADANKQAEEERLWKGILTSSRCEVEGNLWSITNRRDATDETKRTAYSCETAVTPLLILFALLAFPLDASADGLCLAVDKAIVTHPSSSSFQTRSSRETNRPDILEGAICAPSSWPPMRQPWTRVARGYGHALVRARPRHRMSNGRQFDCSVIDPSLHCP